MKHTLVMDKNSLWGLFGITGALLACIADVFIAWTEPGTPPAFTQVFQINLARMVPILQQRTHLQLIGSHTLSFLGIGLETYGLLMLYRLLTKKVPRGASALMTIGLISLAAGMLYHQGLTYFAAGLQQNSIDSSMYSEYWGYLEPFGFIFVGGFTVMSVILLIILFRYFKAGVIPTLLSAPLCWYVIFSFLVNLLPADLRTVYIYTLFNLSVGMSYLWFLLVTRRKTGL